MYWCTSTLFLQISLLLLLGIKADVKSPENITITFLSSESVKISWSVKLKNIEKYDIMYKPTEANYKIVAVVASNFNSVTLNNLLPSTQYKMSVTAIKSGKKYRSKPIIFKTLETGAVVTDAITTNDNETTDAENVITIDTPDIVAGADNIITPNSVPLPPPYGPSNTPQTYIQECGRKKYINHETNPLDVMKNVRGIEVTIVVLVLMVWVGAIILFFNRWGKIRMLIPYQPDYKETQLKVPGTGACSSANTYQNQSTSALCCAQRHATYQCPKHARHHHDCSYLSSGSATTKRARFQSVSCQYMKLADRSAPVRKTKSADYIPCSYGRLEQCRPIKKIPTVSISIASDSDNGLNEDSS